MHPIKEYCKDNNLTQKAFAERACLHPQEISDYIRGIKKPGPAAIQKICTASQGNIAPRDLRPDLAAIVDGGLEANHTPDLEAQNT